MNTQNTLGIDIGGTRLRAGLVSPGGAVLSRAVGVTPARSTGQAVVDDVAKVVAEAIRGHDPASILAAGVCAPGPLDAERGIAQATPTIDGFRDFPIRDRIAVAIGLPTYLDHDGHAAAYGEWRFGAGQGVANMVFVTVSTGIGGGAIVDGRLQRGRRGMAAHVGHMTIDPNGPRCNCGNKGCWEAFAAGPAFALAARDRGFADGAAVFAAARAGDPAALDLTAAEARLLGIGIVNLVHIYSPDVVVLGGGMSAGLDLMRAGIETYIAEHAMSPFARVAIRAGAMGDTAGLVGAAALARDLALGRAGDTP